MPKKFKQFSWPLFLSLIVLVVGFSSLFLTWALVDDAGSILAGRTLNHYLTSGQFDKFFSFFLEYGSGRFRPVYWLMIWGEYNLGGTHPQIHYFLHLLLFFATSILIYYLVFKITQSSLAGFLAGLFFIFPSVNIDNWYRLGNQESRLVFWLILSILLFYLALKSEKKIFLILAILSALGVYLTKENGLAFFVLPLIWLLFSFTRKNLGRNFRKKILIFFLANLVFLLLSRAGPYFLGVRSGYMEAYRPDFYWIVKNFRWYFYFLKESFGIFLWLSLLSLIWQLFLVFEGRLKNKTCLIWEISFLILFLTFFALQLPLILFEQRYLLPATISLALFLGISLFFLLEKVGSFRPLFQKSIYFIFFLLIINFLFYNGVRIRNYISNSLKLNSLNWEMVSYLASNTPNNANLYFNFPRGDQGQEYIVNIKKQLPLFFKRSDLKVDYYEKSKTIGESSLLIFNPKLLFYPEEDFVTFTKVKEFRVQNSELVVTTTSNLLKQTIRKIFDSLVLRKPFTHEGIYTFWVEKYQWNIYRLD